MEWHESFFSWGNSFIHKEQIQLFSPTEIVYGNDEMCVSQVNTRECEFPTRRRATVEMLAGVYLCACESLTMRLLEVKWRSIREK